MSENNMDDHGRYQQKNTGAVPLRLLIGLKRNNKIRTISDDHD